MKFMKSLRTNQYGFYFENYIIKRWNLLILSISYHSHCHIVTLIFLYIRFFILDIIFFIRLNIMVRQSLMIEEKTFISSCIFIIRQPDLQVLLQMTIRNVNMYLKFLLLVKAQQARHPLFNNMWTIIFRKIIKLRYKFLKYLFYLILQFYVIDWGWFCTQNRKNQ